MGKLGKLQPSSGNPKGNSVKVLHIFVTFFCRFQQETDTTVVRCQDFQKRAILPLNNNNTSKNCKLRNVGVVEPRVVRSGPSKRPSSSEDQQSPATKKCCCSQREGVKSTEDSRKHETRAESENQSKSINVLEGDPKSPHKGNIYCMMCAFYDAWRKIVNYCIKHDRWSRSARGTYSDYNCRTDDP